MEAYWLKWAGLSCAAFWGAMYVACRNSDVELASLPSGSLFEADIISTCLVTGARKFGRCQCLFTSTGGQGYEKWLPVDELLIGIATIPANGLMQPEGEGGVYLRGEHAVERAINDRVDCIAAGARVRHVRRHLLVALSEVRAGERRCKHYSCTDRSVEEWLPLNWKVTPKRPADAGRPA